MKFGALFTVLSIAIPVVLPAANYTAQRTTDHGVAIIRLTDKSKGVEVSIAPSLGNLAYEMKVHGKNILYFPAADIGEFQKRPSLSGVPFLAPWANRLNEQGFWANGKKYAFDMAFGNIRGALPIHGLVSASNLWEVTEVATDRRSARITSRLQFWKSPALMAQWPFAHEYEMTYRLSEGVLEVRVTVTNLSTDSMPLALGFHPYYRIPGVPRDEWTATLPARTIVVTDDRLIPTGEMKPFDLPNPLPLVGHTLDTGFADLERDADGRAHFSIEARGMKVEALFGPKYPIAVVWEPPAPAGETRDFICFEPMTAITSAINLQHEGKYSTLQMLAPGTKWAESFWIRTSGI
jgi:aldose 1-epimerase